jgi:hypothetical protein
MHCNFSQALRGHQIAHFPFQSGKGIGSGPHTDEYSRPYACPAGSIEPAETALYNFCPFASLPDLFGLFSCSMLVVKSGQEHGWDEEMVFRTMHF